MAEGKVIIKGENKTKEAIGKAKEDLFGFGDAAKEVGDKITSAFKLVAAYEGLKKLGETAIDLVEEFGTAQRYTIALSSALDGNFDRISKNSEVIETLGGKTLSSKDSVKALVTELSSLGKSDDDINRIATAAVNLSNITGQDVQAAFTQLNGTFEGSVGKLGKLIPELNNLTTEQLKNGDAIDIVNSKLQKVTDAMAGGVSQKLHNLADAWGDTREAMGQALDPIASPVISWLTNMAVSIGKNITKANDLRDALKNVNDINKETALRAQITVASNSIDVQEGYRTSEMKTAGLYKGYDFWARQQTLQGTDSRFINLAEFNKQVDLINSKYSSVLQKAKDDLAKAQQDLADLLKAQPKSTSSSTSSSSTPYVPYQQPGYTETSYSALAAAGRSAFGLANPTNNNYAEMFTQQETIISKTYDMRDALQEVKTGWIDTLDTLGQRFTGLNGMISDTVNTLGSGMASALEQVGRSLVEGGDSWKNLGAIALNTLSQVLEGIGAQLAAMAALKLIEGDWGNAALAAAGSAAAYVSAGAISASASKITSDSSKSSSTSASGSSYNASSVPQNLYYNFFQNAPVYGTGGEEELALVIRREFEKMGYYAH